MTKNLLITSSQKGGVGKTFLANVLLDLYRQKNMPVDAFDGDGSIGGLISIHGTRLTDGEIAIEQDPSCGVAPYDIRDHNSRAQLINSLETDADIILHDLAGGSLGDLCMLFGDDPATGLLGLDEVLEDLKVNLTILHLITRDEGSVASVELFLSLTEGCERIRHIAVINWHRARETDLWLWFGTGNGDHGGQTRNLFLHRGGLEMSIPDLDDSTAAILTSAAIPFSVAIEQRSLSLLHRQRSKLFFRTFEAGLSDEVRDRLGLAV